MVRRTSPRSGRSGAPTTTTSPPGRWRTTSPSTEGGGPPLLPREPHLAAWWRVGEGESPAARVDAIAVDGPLWGGAAPGLPDEGEGVGIRLPFHRRGAAKGGSEG